MDSVQNTTLFVGDLSVSCNEADLYQLFASHGGVRNVRVMRTRKNLSLGYSFVEMTSHAEAVHVATRLNGAELCGRNIRIAFATQEQHSNKPRQGQGRGGGGHGMDGSVQFGLINQNFNSRGATVEETVPYGAALAGGYGGRGGAGGYSGNPVPTGMWAFNQRNANHHPVLNDPPQLQRQQQPFGGNSMGQQQQLTSGLQKQQQGSDTLKMQPNCQNSVFFRFLLIKAENPMHRQVAINEPTIRDIFNCYGQVPNCVQDVTIRRMTESGEQKKGYGFIHFVDVLACAHALQNHPTVRHNGVTYVLEISKNLEKQIALELEKANAGVGGGAVAEATANAGAGASVMVGGAGGTSSTYSDFEINPAGSESCEFASQLACYSFETGADGTDGDSHTIGTAGKHSSDSYASSADNANLFVSHSTSKDSADNFLSPTNLGSLSLNANNVSRSDSFSFPKAGSLSKELSFWEDENARGTSHVSDSAPCSGSAGARSPVGSPLFAPTQANINTGSNAVAAASGSQASSADAPEQHAPNSHGLSPPPPGLTLDGDRDASTGGGLDAAALMQRQQMYRAQQQMGFRQQQLQADCMVNLPPTHAQGQANPLYRVSCSGWMQQQQQASARIARGSQNFALNAPPAGYHVMDSSPDYMQRKKLQLPPSRRSDGHLQQHGGLPFHQLQQQQQQLQQQLHAMAQQSGDSSRITFAAPMNAVCKQGQQQQQQQQLQFHGGGSINAQRQQYLAEQPQQRMYSPAPGTAAPMDAQSLQQQYFAMQQQQLYQQLYK